MAAAALLAPLLSSLLPAARLNRDSSFLPPGPDPLAAAEAPEGGLPPPRLGGAFEGGSGFLLLVGRERTGGGGRCSAGVGEGQTSGSLG